MYFLFKNELILVAVLDAIFDTVSSLLRGSADKRTMLDNLELVLLTIDEVVRVFLGPGLFIIIEIVSFRSITDIYLSLIAVRCVLEF